MDWNKILYSFIGSFFGFAFALIAQTIYVKIENCTKKKRIVENIVDELSAINDYLRNRKMVMKPIAFQTPIWESIISAGYLLDLIKDKKIFYDQIIIIYNKINMLKILEQNMECNREQIMKIRDNINERIDELL